MGSFAVVVLYVDLQDRAQMSLAEDEDPIEALGADGPDETLGVGVGLLSQPGGAEDFDALSSEDLVEAGGEAFVPVLDEIADGLVSTLPDLGEIAGDLGAPRRIGGPIGHPADVDPS